jgi:4-aminobutyrate---pyruvate transaminase
MTICGNQAERRSASLTEIGFAAPDAVYVCPPLIITRAEIDELIQALAAALNDGYAEAVRRGLVGGAVKQAAV